MKSDKYCKAAVETVMAMLAEEGRELKSGKRSHKGPLPPGYKSELDIIKELDTETLQLVKGSICLVYWKYQANASTVICIFGWCTCGICHIPTIHQPMSHLHKFPICVNIRSFVVIYARCTPGFGTVVGIFSFCTKMYAPHMPGFWQSI